MLTIRLRDELVTAGEWSWGFAILLLHPGMRLLVFVFAASFVVLLLAGWGVLRVVRSHGARRSDQLGTLRLTETPPEAELEQDAREE